MFSGLQMVSSSSMSFELVELIDVTIYYVWGICKTKMTSTDIIYAMIDLAILQLTNGMNFNWLWFDKIKTKINFNY